MDVRRTCCWSRMMDIRKKNVRTKVLDIIVRLKCAWSLKIFGGYDGNASLGQAYNSERITSVFELTRVKKAEKQAQCTARRT